MRFPLSISNMKISIPPEVANSGLLLRSNFKGTLEARVHIQNALAQRR